MIPFWMEIHCGTGTLTKVASDCSRLNYAGGASVSLLFVFVRAAYVRHAPRKHHRGDKGVRKGLRVLAVRNPGFPNCPPVKQVAARRHSHRPK